MPLVQGKYKMTMGLEPMHPMDWIEIDENYEEEMALRRKLAKEKRDIVIHSLPGVSSNRPMLEHAGKVNRMIAHLHVRHSILQLTLVPIGAG